MGCKRKVYVVGSLNAKLAIVSPAPRAVRRARSERQRLLVEAALARHVQKGEKA